MKSIYQLLNDYDVASLALEIHKTTEFPDGELVFVDCDKYKGEGIIRHEANCSPRKLSVLLGNGQVWYYPIEKCKLI